MIHADVRGKLRGSSGSRSEDVLTSSVLGLLRLVPEKLRAFLMLARKVTLVSGEAVVDEPGTGLDLGADLDVLFWQRLGRHGEIDAVVVEGAADAPARIIGLEAKFESDKSEARRTASAGEASDQLDEYWRGLATHAFTGPARIGLPRLPEVHLVYVTAHVYAPTEELAASLKLISARSGPAHLAWLSWRDAYRLLDRAQPNDRVAQDLRTLLESKDLVPFLGFSHLKKPVVPTEASFFDVTRYGQPTRLRIPSPLPSPLFWR